MNWFVRTNCFHSLALFSVLLKFHIVQHFFFFCHSIRLVRWLNLNSFALLAANKAREAFKEVDQRVRDIGREIRQIEESSSKDYGLEEEFQPLEGKCFDYTDREYTYRLCLFDFGSQRPKHGGSETRLGSWGYWDGPAENKYSQMKYDKGVQCWNGPQRTLQVRYLQIRLLHFLLFIFFFFKIYPLWLYYFKSAFLKLYHTQYSYMYEFFWHWLKYFFFTIELWKYNFIQTDY